MSGFKSLLKEWMTFSASERWGMIGLFALLLIAIATPYFFKTATTADDIEKLRSEMSVFLAEMERNKTVVRDTVFYFDPNAIDSASLTLLGFSPRQARSLVNYRNKGGRFYNKESFGRSYVVSDEMFARLYDYIVIKPDPRRGRYEKTTYPTREHRTFEKREPTARNTADEKTPVATRTTQSPVVVEQPEQRKLSSVEINLANADKLQELRGIGEYYASRIVEYRDKLGGFNDVSQLLEIRGIDSARFAQFAAQVQIDLSAIKRININAASENELARHPYIGNYLAKSILKYRGFKEKIDSGKELVDARILSAKQWKRMEPYVEF